MGNTISYIGSHGRRLLNRYNAQFRALKFLEKEKLPGAPRHALPSDLHEDPVTYEHLHEKDLSLDKYLKSVYVKSYGEEPLATDHKNPQRPLPSYNEAPKQYTFKEPEEMIKGFCTLSQFFEFREAHENDPVGNSAAVIAKNYSLDIKKVENLIKYYSVFMVYESKKGDQEDEPEENLYELLETVAKKKQLSDKKQFSGKKKSTGKSEEKMLQSESQEREMESLKSKKEKVKN